MVCFSLLLITTTAFLRTSRAFEDDESYLPACASYDCGPGRVCLQQSVGFTCAVKNGLPCIPSDHCEGEYDCPSTKICAGGPDGIPEGSSCPKGVGCKPGLYCDQNQKKCLKTDGGEFCVGDSQCTKTCFSLKGCYCYNGKCISNP